MDTTCPNRPPIEQVQYLEYPPQRPHVEIGIITPPSGEYDTEAAAVKEMRKIAPSMEGMRSTLNQQQKKAAGDLASVGSAVKAASDR